MALCAVHGAKSELDTGHHQPTTLYLGLQGKRKSLQCRREKNVIFKTQHKSPNLQGEPTGFKPNTNPKTSQGKGSAAGCQRKPNFRPLPGNVAILEPGTKICCRAGSVAACGQKTNTTKAPEPNCAESKQSQATDIDRYKKAFREIKCHRE